MFESRQVSTLYNRVLYNFVSDVVTGGLEIYYNVSSQFVTFSLLNLILG